jgi:hypothetical protein
LYTLVNITSFQFFGREDSAVDEFFDNNHLDINAPLVTNERSLRVRNQFDIFIFSIYSNRHQQH